MNGNGRSGLALMFVISSQRSCAGGRGELALGVPLLRNFARHFVGLPSEIAPRKSGKYGSVSGDKASCRARLYILEKDALKLSGSKWGQGQLDFIIASGMKIRLVRVKADEAAGIWPDG
jgi:hypothetical protein